MNRKRRLIDIRVQQAAAFLERACALLPKDATRKTWQRISVKIVCKRVGWKASPDSFLRQFEKLRGHTLKKHMDLLWRERRERLKAAQRSLPYTFQVGATWLYYPRWLPPGTQVGDWVRLEADGSVRQVDGPEQAATG